jgi:hypothetical protein
MNRILTSVAAATAAIGVASAVPAPASANPVIVAPAVAALILGGAVVGGVALGAAVANNHPQGRVMVSDAQPEQTPGPVASSAALDQPQPPCTPSRARIHGVWRNIQICD